MENLVDSPSDFPSSGDTPPSFPTSNPLLKRPPLCCSISGPINQSSGQEKELDSSSDLPYLPPDILYFISTKLTTIYDSILFRGVCRSWRSAAGPVWDHIRIRTISAPLVHATPNDLHPLHQPWLFLPTRYRDRGDTSTLSFFNPFNRSIYEFYLPEAQGRHVFGSCHGWLVIIDDLHFPLPLPVGRAVSLLNPITKAHLLLPRLPKIHLLPYAKVLLSTANPQNLVVALWSCSDLFVLRHGHDDHWTMIDMDPYMTSDYGDIKFFQDEIYMLNGDGRLGLFHIPSMTLHISTRIQGPACAPPWEYYGLARHLVEAPGNLLMIVCESRYLKLRFRVFKLYKNRSEGILRWERVDRDFLGNNTLLMSSMQSISICTAPKAGRANRIYFVEKEFQSPKVDPAEMAASTEVFTLADGFACSSTKQTSERMRGITKRFLEMPGLTWIVPSFN